jgi:gluconate 2-dehydrogenase gamma chain
VGPDSRRAAVFTKAQTRTLEAILARLIPADEHGPGAIEAGVLTYIEQALAGELEPLQDTYADGLRRLDALAVERYAAPFADLRAPEQDAILRELENSHFFWLVHEHALEGMFGDPSYGGNAGLAGWDLLGFPGVRRSVPPVHQALDFVVEPARTSRLDLGLTGSSE